MTLKKIKLILITLIITNVEVLNAQIPPHLEKYKKLYKKSPHKAAIKWFEEARFGLFIHWGPASQYLEGEWVMYNKMIPVEEYEKSAKLFTGNKFDARKIVQLALNAEMKYITFVAKHHDGFALWDSNAGDYNSMDYPAKRDFLKELAKECHKAEIGLFIYYSIGIDWHHPYFLPIEMYNPARPHYKKTPRHYKYKNPKDFKHYLNFAKTQIMELCTMYGSIAGIWFDTIGGIYQNQKMFNIQEIYDEIHAIQPHALVVFKTGANGNEDFITGEREMRSLGQVFKNAGLPKKVIKSADKSWEKNKYKLAELNIPMQTIGWAYHKDAKQKSFNEVMELLQKCGMMRANLLLNIALYPDGSILPDNEKVLTEIGKYVKKNGFPKLNTKDYMKYRENPELIKIKSHEIGTITN